LILGGSRTHVVGITDPFEMSGTIPNLNVIEFKKLHQVDTPTLEDDFINNTTEFPTLDEIIPIPLQTQTSIIPVNTITSFLSERCEESNEISFQSLLSQVGSEHAHKTFLAMIHFAHHTNVKGRKTVEISSDPMILKIK
jgi:hypothetical protein